MVQEWEVTASNARGTYMLRVGAQSSSSVPAYLTTYGNFDHVVILPTKEGDKIGLSEGEIAPQR